MPGQAHQPDNTRQNLYVGMQEQVAQTCRGSFTRAAIAVVGGVAVLRFGASLDHIFMAVSLGMMSFGLFSRPTLWVWHPIPVQNARPRDCRRAKTDGT
jgi:hypothetical protein